MPSKYWIGVGLIWIWANQIAFQWLLFGLVLLYHWQIHGKGRTVKHKGGSGNSMGVGNGNRNWNNGSLPPLKDKIHHFSLQFNPKIVEKNQSVMEVLHEICIAIYEKNRHKAIVYATTNIQPPPKPITKIETYFLFIIAKLQDFFPCLSYLKQIAS